VTLPVVNVLLGLVAVMWPQAAVDRIAGLECSRELERKSQLAATTDAVRNEHRDKQRERALEQAVALRRTLVRSFGLVASAVLATLVLIWLRIGSFAGVNASGWLAVFSVAILAWATIGRLTEMGEEALSWKGDTVIERTDKVVFQSPVRDRSVDSRCGGPVAPELESSRKDSVGEVAQTVPKSYG
jgi:hypothetical protein